MPDVTLTAALTGALTGVGVLSLAIAGAIKGARAWKSRENGSAARYSTTQNMLNNILLDVREGRAEFQITMRRADDRMDKQAAKSSGQFTAQGQDIHMINVRLARIESEAAGVAKGEEAAERRHHSRSPADS